MITSDNFSFSVISRKLRTVRSSPDDLITSDISVIISFQPQPFVISRVLHSAKPFRDIRLLLVRLFL